MDFNDFNVQGFQGQKMIMICPCYELKLIHTISTTVCNKQLGSLIPKERRKHSLASTNYALDHSDSVNN